MILENYPTYPADSFCIKIEYVSDFQPPLQYATSGSAGFDLIASEDITLQSQETKLIPTGIKMEIPDGYELQIRPRSGVSLKTPLRICNSPGTIDSDYRGEIKIIMQNTEIYDLDPIVVKKGERIAQGVFCPVKRAVFFVGTVGSSERGQGGFGSTGV